MPSSFEQGNMNFESFVWSHQSIIASDGFVLSCRSEGHEDEAGRAAEGLRVGPACGDTEAEGDEAPEGERVPQEEAGELWSLNCCSARSPCTYLNFHTTSIRQSGTEILRCTPRRPGQKHEHHAIVLRFLFHVFSSRGSVDVQTLRRRFLTRVRVAMLTNFSACVCF